MATTVSECCVRGFQWSSEPTGKETHLNDLDVYVIGPDSSQIEGGFEVKTKAAVLFIHDLLGWKFPNARLLADHYAREANVTVYIPDFFAGESLPWEDVLDDEQRSKMDLPSFISRNGKEQRRDAMFSFARYLRSQYHRVATIGFCYGGWAVFHLGNKNNIDSTSGQPLVDCITAVHPSLLTKEEIDAVGVPVQILAPEHDPVFTEELKEYANKVITTKGIDYEYRFFPGVEHAFGARGDPNKKNERRAMRQAKDAAVTWFKEFLFEHDDV